MIKDIDISAIRERHLDIEIVSLLCDEIQWLRADKEARRAVLVATIMKVRALYEYHRSREEHAHSDGAWAALKIIMDSQ